MLKSRPIAHPDWLKQALNDFTRTSRLYREGKLPSSIEFFMVETAVHRLHRLCFKSRWHMLWFLFVSALKSEREKLYGIFYRFWRYRVQMKSQEADMHELMTSVCPHCEERRDIPQVGKDLYKCSGCGGEMDFCELAAAQPEDEDDE